VIFCLCVGKALGCCFGSRGRKCGSGHVPVRVGAKGMTKKPAEGLGVRSVCVGLQKSEQIGTIRNRLGCLKLTSYRGIEMVTTFERAADLN
jgi:hypothetical protein